MKTMVRAAAFVAAFAMCSTGSVRADYRHHSPNEGQPVFSSQAAVNGTNNGATCKVSFSTDTSTLTPPDDNSNPTGTQAYTAGGVAAVKPCSGNVIAFFSSEISTPNPGDFIHLRMRATCQGAGGQSNPCTTGQVVFAAPGAGIAVYLNTNQVAGLQTHGMTMVFPTLPKGLWKFEALVGGNGTASVGYRTFVVEMFGS